MSISAHWPFSFGHTFLFVRICPTRPQFLHFLAVVALPVVAALVEVVLVMVAGANVAEGGGAMGELGVAADSGDMASPPMKLPVRLPLSRSRASRRSLLRSRRLSSFTSLRFGLKV